MSGKFRKRFEPKKEKQEDIATLVVTMGIPSGNFRIAGNVLKDRNLCLRMFVEAAHRVMTTQPEPMGASESSTPPGASLAVH